MAVSSQVDAFTVYSKMCLDLSKIKIDCDNAPMTSLIPCQTTCSSLTPLANNCIFKLLVSHVQLSYIPHQGCNAGTTDTKVDVDT